ncbi:Integrase [Halopseudomonas formosensis]|uniref:Integrase n=1 Tax=Halopseudomonas formosensis TaxID=1002526 RepID=A0A1I6BZ81_9GAMM|nr:site-specific integrase [Halopseudomonas formosensis]SFQ86165.1 Integrase [Halopseudomonas formosensis]
MGKLNPKQVENLTDPGTYEDGEGLRLAVRPTGSKSWVFRYQLNGKRREMGLGPYPDLGLKAARLKASAYRSQLLEGIDPLEALKAEREALRLAQLADAAKAVTFDSVAADYIAAHRSGWKNAKHAQQWENTLKTYASPVIGKLAPSDVTTAHVLEVLNKDNFWSMKPETASRVRNRIELVLDAAKAKGLREGENPARWRGHLDKLLPRRDKIQAVKHHTALPYPALPAFMALLTGDDMTTKAMQMTILTACRTSEVLGATWDEIDLQARIWTIPANRMKARKEHRVPLADAVLALLASLPRIEGNPHLFPGMKAGRPLSNMAMLMGLRRMGRDDLTMHGFRSTFRDWAGECTPHPRDVCEQALAHSLGNDVEAAYRRGDLLEKRRALMNDWAAYCTSKPTSNVIQMRREGAK